MTTFFKEEEKRTSDFYVKTNLVEIRNSEIHGLGVFAKQDIPRKTIVEVAPVLLFHNKTVDALNEVSDPYRHAIMDYPFWWGDGYSAFSFGWGGIYNHSKIHSDGHNAQWKKIRKDEKGYNALMFITRRDIRKDEELCICYHSIEELIWFNQGGTITDMVSIGHGATSQNYYNE